MLVLVLLVVLVRGAGAEGSLFAGVYSLDHARSSSVGKAIDSCVSHMNLFKRAIARPLLEKANIPAETLSVSSGEDGLRISQGDDPPATCREDGRESNWTDHGGSVYKLTCEQEKSRLVLGFRGKNGQSRNEYRLGEEGMELQLVITVSSPHLPVPLTYLLDYHRLTGTSN